jgi:hypothetical protein
VAISFPPRVGTVFAERYQLRELLGGGGVGLVFRAWDLEAQRLVALKVFNPARVSAPTWKAYAEVVNAALAVRHPDVILPQAGVPEELPDAPAVVLEALVGEDLASLRARQSKVPWARAMEIGARCAVILDALVARTGIGHRDLKPGNVFIDQSGSVKLLDYGVAEFDVQSAESTRVDSALGMVDYKAPEQLEHNVGGHQSDMFALAVITYEMIAGVRPFAGPSYFEVARKILLESAPRLGEVVPEARVPVGVDVFLHRAFEKRPDDRYSDLAAMHRAFVEVLRGAPRSTVIGATRAEVLKAAAEAEAEEQATLLVKAAGGRKGGGSALQQMPTATSRPAGRQVVPTGARAVVGAGDDAGPANGDRTVVSMAGMPPAADRTMILADPRLTGSDDDEPRTTLQARSGGRSMPPPAERTMILRDDAVSGAPQPAERTMILRDDAVSGAPQPAERTMILRDDAVSGAPQPAERTMIIRDDAVSGAPSRRGEGTLELPGERAEGTLQLQGERAPARPWTLQRILIVVNVTCGVLILIGLLVMVLSGGDAGGAAGK